MSETLSWLSLSLDWTTTTGRLHGPTANLSFFAKEIRMLCCEFDSELLAICPSIEEGRMTLSVFSNGSSELVGCDITLPKKDDYYV